MPEAERTNFSVSNLSEDSSDSPKRLSKNTGFYTYDCPNLQDIIRFIKSKDLPPDDEALLIKKAKNTPHGSLANFRKNYKIHLRNK